LCLKIALQVYSISKESYTGDVGLIESPPIKNSKYYFNGVISKEGGWRISHPLMSGVNSEKAKPADLPLSPYSSSYPFNTQGNQAGYPF
jgi:hypothetical protein